jgi:curved DNA-binding protein
LKNYYADLGITDAATQDEIRKAYRKLAAEHHPDKNDNSKESEEKFKIVSEAYETLGNEAKRKAYDASRTNSSKYSDFFGSFTDFDFSSKYDKFDTRILNVTVDKWATIKELMEGKSFDLEYVIMNSVGSESLHEWKSVSLSINLLTGTYPISFKNGQHVIVLKVRGGGSKKEIKQRLQFGLESTSRVSGDLIVNVNIDMLGLSIEHTDLVQETELTLYDVLFGKEIILESNLGKKFRIKSLGSNKLTDLRIRIPEMGLVSEYGNRGGLIFKINVKMPDLAQLTEEELTSLRDLLISVNK